MITAVVGLLWVWVKSSGSHVGIIIFFFLLKRLVGLTLNST